MSHELWLQLIDLHLYLNTHPYTHALTNIHTLAHNPHEYFNLFIMAWCMEFFLTLSMYDSNMAKYLASRNNLTGYLLMGPTDCEWMKLQKRQGTQFPMQPAIVCGWRMDLSVCAYNHTHYKESSHFVNKYAQNYWIEEVIGVLRKTYGKWLTSYKYQITQNINDPFFLWAC